MVSVQDSRLKLGRLKCAVGAKATTVFSLGFDRVGACPSWQLTFGHDRLSVCQIREQKANSTEAQILLAALFCQKQFG